MEQEKLNIKTSSIYTVLSVTFAILLVWVEIASTSLTLNFFRGLGGEGIVRNGVTGFAIANDILKVVGITLAIVAYRTKEKGHCVIFTIAAIATLIISFFASQAYDLNMHAKLKNETVTQSDGYKRQTEIYGTTKESLKNSQEQLKKMSTVEKYINSNVDIINLKKQIKELGSLTEYQKNNNSDYGSKKFASRASNTNKALQQTYNNKKNELTNKLAAKENILRKEFLSTKKDTEDNIKKYSEELDKINSGFSNLNNVELETTTGMEQFSKNYNLSIKTIAKWKNIHLEFIGVILGIVLAFCWRQRNKYKELELTGNSVGINIPINAKDKTVEAMAQNKLEMKNSNLADRIREGMNKIIKVGWGTEIDTSSYKQKKVNLEKPEVKIGFTPPQKKLSSNEQNKGGKESEPRKKENNDKSLPNTENKHNRQENNLSGVTRNNIIKYLKFLYDKKYWWAGTPTGYKKIEQLAKFEDKNISGKIRNTLETLEIIGTEEKTIGKRKLNVTKLKMELQEAIKNIFKN